MYSACKTLPVCFKSKIPSIRGVRMNFQQISILYCEYPDFSDFSPPITDYDPKISDLLIFRSNRLLNTSKIETMRSDSPPMINMVPTNGSRVYTNDEYGE